MKRGEHWKNMTQERKDEIRSKMRDGHAMRKINKIATEIEKSKDIDPFVPEPVSPTEEETHGC